MKNIRIVMHKIKGRYINEYYLLDHNQDITRLLSNSEAEMLRNGIDYSSDDVYELNHADDYEKIKSPFNGEMLYGAYVFIGSRPDKYGSRF